MAPVNGTSSRTGKNIPVDRKTGAFIPNLSMTKLLPKSHYKNIIACDLSSKTGEGRLALLQIKNAQYLSTEVGSGKNLSKKRLQRRLAPEFQLKSRVLNSLLIYIWLIYQVICLRIYKVSGAVVLNYIPLWNVLFFLLIPKSTVLGPVTGGGKVNLNHLGYSKFKKFIFLLTRNIFIPILYYFSYRVICMRSLKVRPATPSVAKALGFKTVPPRAIEADETLFDLAIVKATETKRKIDLVCYVGPHPLKNTKISIAVLNRLAEVGYVIELIGPIPKNAHLHKKVRHHSSLSRSEVVSIISDSVAVLSLSLEEAGFFTFEAAACGCFILCFPGSGGARLPGAKILALNAEIISEEILFKRCDEAMKSCAGEHVSIASQRSIAAREIHEKAKIFFYQSQ